MRKSLLPFVSKFFFIQEKNNNTWEKLIILFLHFRGSKNGNEIELPAGEHNYPFTFVVPPHVPSSFEGEFGHVRYTIKAVLDRPWKFDQETKMVFTVISPLDLNLDPEMKVWPF